MNTKTTLTEALQTIINKTTHCPDSDLIYITFDYNKGFGATSTNFELTDPEYLYFSNLGEYRQNGWKLKETLKSFDIMNDQKTQQQ